MTRFRIGGVYRKQDGRIAKLTGEMVDPRWEEEYGHKFALSRVDGDAAGYVSLVNGRYCQTFTQERHRDHLLPGELHQVNGEWVPIEDPELLALQTRPQHEPASVEEEPQRAALAWNKATPFDPWGPEFIVHHRESVSVNGRPFRDLSLDGCGSFRAPKAL